MLEQFTIEAVNRIDREKIPVTKGVYCFLITEEGIGKINQARQCIDIILSDLPEIKLKGTTLYLIYIGQAGARNNGRGINLGHIRQRFEWHVSQQHSMSVIKNKTLSSFRATIGSILTDNLFLSESQINNFLRDHLYFGYTTIASLDSNSIILSESILIEKYKPILNSKHNSNAKKGVNHPAAIIANLRKQVYKETMQYCIRGM